jgi:CD109 antigen
MTTKLLGPIAAMCILLILIGACQRTPPSPPTAGPAGTPSGAASPTPRPVVTATPVPLTPLPGPDGYVALVPSTLRSGHSENISLSLFKGNAPAEGTVRLKLTSNQRTVAETSAHVRGSGNVPLSVPRLTPGQYQIEVSGPGFNDKASLKVEDGTLVFLETDKPIYKPGQTIHVRLITLDTMLKPWPGQVTVEVQDAKGIKVFKKELETDDYGMATLDLPLSTEPNLGVWKVVASLGERKTQLDVRVEEYVLPKYEVNVETARDWVLASEPITGNVSAQYTFGKPVVGEVEIVASRYVGRWEKYATLDIPLDGEAEFELPPVRFVAGVPGAQGMGNVTLDVIVREKSTGYEEKTTQIITVAASPVNLRVIPDSNVFKPGLPLSFLVVTTAPDGVPVDTEAQVNLYFMGKDFDAVKQEQRKIETKNGKAIFKLTPPGEALALNLEATARSPLARGQGGDVAHTSLTLQAGYSPSGNFIHVEQTTEGPVKVGDTIKFHVSSTRQASNFYYEVLSRGTVLFTDVSRSADIAFTATQHMAPSSRLVVYQVLQNSEVAADYLPFSVEAGYPHQVEVGFGQEQVRPGEAVDINVQTQGAAKVGLVAVDKSVFILAENRLNLQQVFAELERLYLKPQVELHEVGFSPTITTRGASETFKDAGLVVMTNKKVPTGEKIERPMLFRALAGQAVGEDAAKGAPPPVPAPAAPAATPAPAAGAAPPADLAEVQRVRQFFPETWLWKDLTTDAQGVEKLPVEAPDSITTWMLRAVALSREHGLGIGEAQLRVFQPFFLQVDLPYSAIRGEEFPVKIALYNYLEQPQEIFVELEEADWFDLLDKPAKTATLGASDIGGVEFNIRPKRLGNNSLKVTARSREAADAVIKELLVEPEGVGREAVENHVLSGGDVERLDVSFPLGIVAGSGRSYIAITGSYLTQTIEGLEGLLRMPFGCGEQNMILFAPNVFVARYLRETGQLKPEVMAKAEHLMITGYQRELTYRRSDGSFSAFGDSDDEGSLWLTAFVLKTFAQAKDLIYIDQAVLDEAAAWIEGHQLRDGSFEPVGFLHHQELLGGLQGKAALTAYVAIALMEAGHDGAASKAIDYLEGELDGIGDPYTMAITAYALELGDSAEADEAYQKLMDMAEEDDNGLHWGGKPIEPLPLPGTPRRGGFPEPRHQSAAIETTGYATLALIEHGDRFNASRAARWLASQRNAYGGFDSTQDTVVGLQALTTFATDARSDVDMTVTLEGKGLSKMIRITAENADVLQLIQLPEEGEVTVTARGRGDVVLQSVLRYNLPEPEDTGEEIFQIVVDYGTESVEVDDIITVDVSVKFSPPEPIEAGMVVLDIAVPTGFAPVRESLDELMDSRANLKRYEVAGRKVIFYIEDMRPNQTIAFEFQARALYPVRAKEVTSQAYSYYKPEWKGETLGGAITVVGSR